MRIRILLLFFLLPLADRAGADVVTLPARADNTLYAESGTTSNGAGQHLFAGKTIASMARRGLVAFDISAAIPAGSTIGSVTLRLHMSRTQSPPEGVALHRVLASWGEGASDAPGEEGGGAAAATGDATWTHRSYATQVWTSPGGDFEPSASATTSVAGEGDYSWSSPALTADVQAWLGASATNFGWILIGNESTSSGAKRFDSRENPTAAFQPALEVSFTAPGTTGACCASNGTCSLVLDPGSTCTGSYQGTGSSCEPNPCSQPTGACCLPNAAATCTEVTESGCSSQGGSFQGGATLCALATCPVVLEPFVDALPIPGVAQPVSGAVGGAASYRLAMREVQQKLHRDLPPTTVWGYSDGSGPAAHPGPTIVASVGAPAEVTWVNDLRDGSGALRTQHYLPVDTCIHGAMDASPRTVVHLHGGHVPAIYDGYPDQTILPGQEVTYRYDNAQLPATLWYHDHALGITRLNVTMGMAGFYLLFDAAEQALGLPSGEFEIGLAIQDRSFAPDGSLRYPATWHEHFFGDTILVNGKVWPYLQVKRGKYRFRILSGSNSRTYRLSLSTGASFRVLGMEGGLLPAPIPLDQITLTPGERADVVMDFALYPAGTEILLTNDAPAPFPGTPGVGVIENVMKFVVTDQPGHIAALPASLRPLEVLSEGDAAVYREFELRKGPDPCTGSIWLINGMHWDEITEFPRLGTTEVWSFINRSGVNHPMHLHMTMFQVLDRQPFQEQSGQIVTTGPRVPPPPHEAGWKDTVSVGPKEIVRLIVPFEDYTGRFAYHCHQLEHEEHGMMRQFETVTVCGDGVRGFPQEECDDGNTESGDCCSASCEVESPDGDGDGHCDQVDSCPFWANPEQTDSDGNGRGDACECGDQDGNGTVDVSDLVAINLAIFDPTLIRPLCDASGDGVCNVADIVAVNAEIYSIGRTSTCPRQPSPGP